jgi:serine/threonine protein kinase
MGEDGYVRLTDFGVAKDLNLNKEIDDIAGAYDYIAYEMLKGQDHGLTADWWSLGILTYELIVGFPPFVTDEEAEEDQFANLIERIEMGIEFPNILEHNISMTDKAKDFIV